MKRNHPSQPLTNHIEVPDIDGVMEKVEAAGGKIVVQKTVIPSVGWFCFFTDPEGIILGLWQDDRNAK